MNFTEGNYTILYSGEIMENHLQGTFDSPYNVSVLLPQGLDVRDPFLGMRSPGSENRGGAFLAHHRLERYADLRVPVLYARAGEASPDLRGPLDSRPRPRPHPVPPVAEGDREGEGGGERTAVIEVLLASFAVGLTGAVSPGPMSASILGMSHRKPLLSTLGLVAGHGMLEAFIIVGIIFGLRSLPFQAGIALLGSATIVVLGIVQFMAEPEEQAARAGDREGSSEGGSRGPDLERRSREEPDLEQPAIRWGASARAPFVAGIVLTLSNPYWWIWWLTFGAGFLALQPAYAAFYVGHISADLVWFGILAITASRGAKILGRKLPVGGEGERGRDGSLRRPLRLLYPGSLR